MEHPHHSVHTGSEHGSRMQDHYARLYLMAALSYLAMFALMYAMVDRFSNVYANLNQAYMAALMAAPMVVLEILLMSRMYPNRKKNSAIVIASVIIGLLSWVSIRQQSAIGDTQFLRSMIPHHAGAILMCERLHAEDPDIRKLCDGILRSQEQEIAQMRRQLKQRQ